MNNDASLSGAASEQIPLGGNPPGGDPLGDNPLGGNTLGGNPLGGNPLGVAGLEFVEFSSPDPKRLRTLFEQLGFVQEDPHVSKYVTLYRQGNMNFLVNADEDSFATRFAQ